MLTQKSAIEKVRLFAKQVNKSGIPLKRVVLFGSYAKNTQNKWSDIDVALVADDFNGAGFFDIALFGKTLIKKPFRSIQPKTYNTRHFNPAKDPFVDEILQTGIEIDPY
jgi:predicted nucleotidyltransferase